VSAAVAQCPAEAPPAAECELERLRAEIAAVDGQIVGLLERRARLAREAGALKALSGQSVLDPLREAAVVRHAVALSRPLDLDVEVVRQIFWQIIGLCRRAQLPNA
jgi:chorismate mutase / prephenate dehydratase